MKRTFVAAAVLAALLPITASAQAPAKAKDAPAKAATAAPAGKTLYTPAQFDLLLKERMAQNQPDTPELRNSVREELNTRELLAREARTQGARQERRRQDADGSRRTDDPGARVRR